VFVFTHANIDVAVACVNPSANTLLVLNVLPAHRSHGLGSAILSYICANFARVLESAVPFFERNGYQKVGAMKIGNKLKTQVMIKSSLIPLAGRVAKIYGDAK
jgi:GNAT superfamily N-acetyltransferase